MSSAKNSKLSQLLSFIIEKGIVVLLVATPLAFGSVDVWASSLMEIGIFIVLAAWFIKGLICGRLIVETSWALYLLCALIALTALQLLPLPDAILSVISPNRLKIDGVFLDKAEGAWSSISVYRYATLTELQKLLSYTALFVVITSHYRSKEQVMVLVRTVLSMGVFIAVFAVVQKLAWNGKLYWFYPLPIGVDSDATHVWGPYLNHNHFAGYMEMSVLLALGLFLYRSTNLRLMPGISLKRAIARLLSSGKLLTLILPVMAAIVMSAVLFLSLSRGGIAGLTGAALIFTIMVFRRKSLKKRTTVMVIFTLLAVILTLSSSWSRIEDRFMEVGEVGKIKRFELWLNTMDIVKDYPLLGTGLGTFKNIYPYYQEGDSTLFFAYAENDYIESVTDLGIVGGLLIIVMGGLYIRSIVVRWRMRRDSFAKCLGAGALASVATILIHNFSDFNLRIPSNAMLFVVVAALTYSIVFNLRGRRAKGERGGL